MKTPKLLIFMGLFTFLFSCGQDTKVELKSIYPEEEFAVIDGKFDDGRSVIGSLNMAYKNYKYKYKFPWCLRISIALELENCFESGLPNSEEFSIANKLEDELLDKIEDITTSHYIGHLFNDNFLDIYIYLEKPKEVHNWLQTQVNKEGLERGFAYEIAEDPEWDTIKPFMN